MSDTYQRKKVSGNGEVLGNKFGLNYEGANRCPEGYTWVGGYTARTGIFGQRYVAGHCRKISEGAEVENRKGLF